MLFQAAAAAAGGGAVLAANAAAHGTTLLSKHLPLSALAAAVALAAVQEPQNPAPAGLAADAAGLAVAHGGVSSAAVHSVAANLLSCESAGAP